ncbi:FUSC family protein [Candidatus Cetobacterium colombiensis]|uniref:FUSC family protein n=1 Tax=Candidatus Cetobacterium colombiensis TaxID=3073100 RepID=A0ABU4WAI0_9FUSO|nr:FUSC family protein [Candidatus Cetobacterium colombiensis]MDX8335586.1 FUSC family protein [Candidatus Cetobacterium colombiensis]
MDKLTKKTVITISSIVATTLIGQFLNVEPIGLFYTAITCVIITNVDFEELIKTSKFRAIGTLIGGVMGIIFSYIPLFLILKIIIGEILIILFCEKKLNIPSAIASVVFLIIVYKITPEPSYIYGFKRVFDTFSGIFITLVITYTLKRF